VGGVGMERGRDEGSAMQAAGQAGVAVVRSW
jgi:hypothetical protein